MSQRLSGYQRKDRDSYQTPSWPTECLLSHIPDRFESVWEPAAGAGQMAAVLAKRFGVVCSSDIETGTDFLEQYSSKWPSAIITNPPYALAAAFVEHALRLTAPHRGFVAMLLRVDFDSAKSRRHLFGNCPAFSKKIVLTKRIVWFDAGPACPSFNHAWFLWDHTHSGAPTIAYEPRQAAQ